MPYLAASVSVMDYNADPTGSTDSTAAFSAAALAVSNAGGGTVSIPEGTFTITPVSSTSAGIVLNNGTSGYYGVRFVGAGENATVIKRTSNGPIISMSGPASDTTGVTHCRYCTLENLTLSGNSLTGTLIQAYYADDLDFRNVHFENSNDVVFDTAEFWDSRFWNCLQDSSGSLTGGTTAPMMWLRNTAASSGFGYSAGTTNNIYFFGCRWEQYKTGAIRIERGVGTNTGQPYSLYFVSSKLETSVVNGGGPAFFCDTTARDVRVENCHAYQGGFQSGWSTAQDVFTFGPQFGSLRDILVFNSTAVACIANGLTLNAPLANSYVVAESVRGSYTGGATPTGAHVSFGTSTGNFRVMDCQADNGTQYGGTVPGSATEFILTNNNAAGTLTINNGTAVTNANEADFVVIGASAASQAWGVQVTGDTELRFFQNTKGDATYGNGATQDYASLRIAAGVHGFSKSLQVGNLTDIGSNAVGVFKYANATTPPTTNPTGGSVTYATAGQLLARNPQGLVQTLSSVIGTQTSTTTVTGVTAETVLQTVTIPANDPVTGAVYQLTGYGTFTAASGNLTWTVRWGGTAGTSIAALPTDAAPALTNGLFYYDVLLTFRSTTSVTAAIKLDISSSITTDAATSYVGTPTAATTVTTTGSTALTVDITPSVSGDSISLLGGCARRLA
jgi:hypothetical protein